MTLTLTLSACTDQDSWQAQGPGVQEPWLEVLTAEAGQDRLRHRSLWNAVRAQEASSGLSPGREGEGGAAGSARRGPGLAPREARHPRGILPSGRTDSQTLLSISV